MDQARPSVNTSAVPDFIPFHWVRCLAFALSLSLPMWGVLAYGVWTVLS